MSEVTLHGQPVKVGDKVWNYEGLDLEVVYDDDPRDESKHDIIKLSNISVNEHALLWQPIDPAAIEAAKVKPKEPDYDYWWYSKELDATSAHRFTEIEINKIIDSGRVKTRDWVRIEESKREVKP